MSINDKTIVSTSELSAVIGITDRRIQYLEKAGTLKKVSRGRYVLAESVQAYVNYRLAQATSSSEELDLTQEKTLLTKAQREKAEIELAELRDEIYHADYIIPIIQELLLGVRNRLLAIPPRAAPQVIASTELLDVQEIIKREIYDALTELAEWEPDSLRRNKRGEDDEPAK